MSFIPAILIFGLIIFIHELGHFLFARKNGIFVIEFALGMGPKLISKKIGETIYSLRLLPIGGFCNMLGEDEEVEGDERAFSAKGPWARFMVVFGGPLFNFILAFVVALIVMVMGSSYGTNVVEEVSEGSPAALAGLEVGDKIIEINDKKILSSKEITIYINERKGSEIELVAKKASTNNTVSYIIKPKLNEEYGLYQIGILKAQDPKNLFTVIKYAAIEVISWIKLSYYGLVQLISGKIAAQDVSGPIGIVSEVSTTYKDTVEYGFVAVMLTLMQLLMILSVNIGVMNLLPIPALDGGRLIFIIVELIRRKPIDKEKEGLAHTVGFIALMILIALVMYNDIMKYVVRR